MSSDSTDFMFMHRELMFTAHELVFAVHKLMFTVRKHNFSRKIGKTINKPVHERP